jgi:hypothetical protein
MPITQVQLNDAQSLIDLLLGNHDAAQAYSQDPVGWLDANGYGNVSAEAVAAAGASSAAGAGAASAAASASASAGAAGVAAQLNPIVYNSYFEDNSITNNILANGDVTIDNTVQSVDGDGNVLQDDTTVFGDQQVQTGSGIQGQGGDSFGGGDEEGGPILLRTEGGNGLEREDGDDAGDGVNIDDSNVATGDFNQQAIDESTNIDVNPPEEEEPPPPPPTGPTGPTGPTEDEIEPFG